jgi:acyl-CoA synthetase (AMP-forming)/AMP-acid ligase II
MIIQHVHSLIRQPNIAPAWPVQVTFAPFSHVTGSVFIFYSVVAGLTTHLLRRFDLDKFLGTIEENQIEGVFVVPPVAVMMAKSPLSAKYRLSSLKDIVCAAAPLAADLEDQLLQKYPGVAVRQLYGMTETTGFVTAIPRDNEKQKFPRKPRSVGVPSPNATMKVIDIKTGEKLGPKENGEVCVKSPLVMLGYLNNPEATAAAIDKDGYLHTGDIGCYDEDSYIYIVDRLKELIKYNAYQVAPSELEAVLLSHPEVADAGVVGLPDPSAGELPLACVVRKSNATVTELQLQQFVDEKVAAFKKLRGGVHFVSAIPRSTTGKILRREMMVALLKGNL